MAVVEFDRDCLKRGVILSAASNRRLCGWPEEAVRVKRVKPN
jgi:hypothetical protein